MFSSTSYAEWTEVGTSEGNHVAAVYVDFENIRKHGEYVYFWELYDLLKPTKHGLFSAKTYYEGDCQLFRFKTLSFVSHKQPMGRDVGASFSPENPEWEYPPPGTTGAMTLKSVCNR